MKKLTKFDVILNIWVSLIINIALSAVLPALNGFLTRERSFPALQ